MGLNRGKWKRDWQRIPEVKVLTVIFGIIHYASLFIYNLSCGLVSSIFQREKVSLYFLLELRNKNFSREFFAGEISLSQILSVLQKSRRWLFETRKEHVLFFLSFELPIVLSRSRSCVPRLAHSDVENTDRDDGMTTMARRYMV